MSVLTLAVGWAYTQICRIYPDGGGVYTAAKSRSKTLAVIGTGRIGLAVIKKATGFDMNVLCYDPAYQNQKFVAAVQELVGGRPAGPTARTGTRCDRNARADQPDIDVG